MQVADWKSNKNLFLGGVKYFFVKIFKKKVLRKKQDFQEFVRKKLAIFLSDIPRHVIVCKIGIFSCAKFGVVNEQLFEKEFHWIYVKSSNFVNVTESLT